MSEKTDEYRKRDAFFAIAKQCPVCKTPSIDDTTVPTSRALSPGYSQYWTVGESMRLMNTGYCKVLEDTMCCASCLEGGTQREKTRSLVAERSRMAAEPLD